jgi:hypothetical protein
VRDVPPLDELADDDAPPRRDPRLRCGDQAQRRPRDEHGLQGPERHGDLAADVPPDFLQSREPKLRADSLAPVDWPADPALEWCPRGHGDVSFTDVDRWR